MMVKDYDGSVDRYSLISNAQMSIKGSFAIQAKVLDYLSAAGLDIIIPDGKLIVEIKFNEKEKRDNEVEGKESETNQTFVPSNPKYTLSQIILPQKVKQELTDALKVIKYKDLIYNKWGFSKVDPVPRSVINFYGEPGTGKTMCAHAIAHNLGKNILLLNYAEIESKYVGEAPKNLQKAFDTARKEDAVMFFDEADSFLGKRIQNVSHGSDQALNSLRSQMLILLEEFSGIVIFATNLVTNFDTAFESRILKHIYFSLPDKEARAAIIQNMLPQELPKDETFTKESILQESEEIEGLSGREIKNAILDMLLSKASDSVGNVVFSIDDLHKALTEKRLMKQQLKEESSKLLKEKIFKKLKEKVEEEEAVKKYEEEKKQENSH